MPFSTALAYATIFLSYSASLRVVEGLTVPISSNEQLVRSIRMPIPENSIPLTSRASPVCPTNSNLTQCGGQFPSDFCCPEETYCLALNSTTSVTAALCCPVGSECLAIGPVNCLESLQNATLNPTSQLHSNPPTELQTCGNDCCPLGYQCQDSTCQAIVTTTVGVPASTSTSTSTSSTSDFASHTGSTLFPTSSTLPSSSVRASSNPAPSPAPNSSSFSGPSFAAGFFPGIALGALVVGGLLLCLRRRNRRASGPIVEKRNHDRDTLTELGPGLQRRLTSHGRSISEPIVDPSQGYRTEFLNSGMSRGTDTKAAPEIFEYGDAANDTTKLRSELDKEASSRVKALFSHSPFMRPTQSPDPNKSPVPPYMKRGTISSFQISPVRGLRKQRSMRSLRRHVAEGMNRDHPSRRNRPNTESTGSTETIQVLMDTPELRLQHSMLDASTPDERSSRFTTFDRPGTTKTIRPQFSMPASFENPFLSQAEQQTPTRSGRDIINPPAGLALGSPYTPENFDASNPGRSKASISIRDPQKPQVRRNTSFSAMMEQAGLTEEILLGRNATS